MADPFGGLAHPPAGDLRRRVEARPCQGCGHPRNWHTGWLYLYRCDAEALSSDDCSCPGFDVIEGSGRLE